MAYTIAMQIYVKWNIYSVPLDILIPGSDRVESIAGFFFMLTCSLSEICPYY